MCIRDSVKRYVLELGGKDPAIVFDDADPEKTAKEIVNGAFSYSGQRCTAIKRLIASKVMIEKLKPFLIKYISALSVGNPEDDNDIVPLISKASADFVESLINDAAEKGANVLIKQKRISETLLSPALIEGVTRKMRVFYEEQFGPILPLIEANTLEEQIACANDSEFGLQASIFTKNVEQARKIAPLIKAGTVNINTSSARAPDIFPYIGLKNSGINSQGSRQALLSVTEYKGIVTFEG